MEYFSQNQMHKGIQLWMVRLTKGFMKMVFYKHLKARSSVGERFLDAEEAKGSIPFAPTI